MSPERPQVFVFFYFILDFLLDFHFGGTQSAELSVLTPFFDVIVKFVIFISGGTNLIAVNRLGLRLHHQEERNKS